MKPYKLVAAKLQRLNWDDLIKARIYLEIEDLDIDHDPFVEYGYQVWENSDYLSPEEIGIAIHYGIDYHGLTDPEEVISQGLDYLRS
jgi:hypothetical protein